MGGNGVDHYEILGVARNATAPEVKKAYFRLVRVHTPEDDAERFQAISAAYAVLSDPEARKAYDAEERLPPEVVATLSRAASLCEKHPDEAAAAAKSLLAAHGSSQVVRFAVATLCIRAKRSREAIPILEQLLLESPERAEWLCAMGDAYRECGRLDDAQSALQRSLAIDAKQVAAYMGLANVHDARSQPDGALRVLDDGIAAFSGADLTTLPLRIRKLYVLAQDGHWNRMERVVDGIVSIVPPGDNDAAQHAAMQIAWIARQYDEAGIFDVAKFALDAALRLAPHAGIKARSVELAPRAEKARACRTAHGDERVADWIRALLPQHFGRRMPAEAWKKQWHAIVARISASPPKAEREWSTFRGAHAVAAEALAENWKMLRHQGRASKRPAPSGAGRLAWVCVMLLISVGRLATCSSESSRPAPIKWDSTQEADRLFQEAMKNVTKEDLDRILQRAAKVGRIEPLPERDAAKPSRAAGGNSASAPAEGSTKAGK